MSNVARISKVMSFLGATCAITGAFVIVLVVGHLILELASWAKWHLQPEGFRYFEAVRATSVYDGYVDKAAMLAEGVALDARPARFEPCIHWRGPTFQGAHINVAEDGVRRTVAGEIRLDAKKVFLFGGSAMWGANVPDQYTIPSYLQTRLGAGFRVYNYAERGWVSVQELNYLLHYLARGNVPDYVVFYDGVNDGYGGVYSPAIPRDPHRIRLLEMDRRRYDGWTRIVVDAYERSSYRRFTNHVRRKLGWDPVGRWEAGIEGRMEENAAAVVSVHDAHVRQVRAIAAEYGFKALFFWQPNLFASGRSSVPYERDFRRTFAQHAPLLEKSQQLVYRNAKQAFGGREGEGFFFIGDIFEEVDGPIYLDWAHVGPRGNEIIATEIGRRLAAIAGQ